MTLDGVITFLNAFFGNWGKFLAVRPERTGAARTAHHRLHNDKYKRAFLLLTFKSMWDYSAHNK